MQKIHKKDSYVLKKVREFRPEYPVTRYRYRQQVLEQLALLFCLCGLILLLLVELLSIKPYIFLSLLLVY